MYKYYSTCTYRSRQQYLECKTRSAATDFMLIRWKWFSALKFFLTGLVSSNHIMTYEQHL